VNISAAIAVLMLCAESGQGQRTFADRQWQAEVASRSDAGRQHGEKIRALMQWSQGQCANLSSEAFSLVGDVLPTGELNDIEVQPNNKYSECYANAFRHIHRLPRPPVSFGSAGFPFAFTVTAPIY
jgi:hypothetical protein